MKNASILCLLAALMATTACRNEKKLTGRKMVHYMEHAYLDLRTSLNDAEVTLLTDTVKVIFPESVMFDFASARIKSTEHPAFDRFANVLNNYKHTKILITGYADTVGNANNNVFLSLRRSDSAKNVLSYYSVSPKRIYTWGLGSKNPRASNETAEGRAKNRRVEFIILYNYRLEENE